MLLHLTWTVEGWDSHSHGLMEQCNVYIYICPTKIETVGFHPLSKWVDSRCHHHHQGSWKRAIQYGHESYQYKSNKQTCMSIQRYLHLHHCWIYNLNNPRYFWECPIPCASPVLWQRCVGDVEVLRPCRSFPSLHIAAVLGLSEGFTDEGCWMREVRNSWQMLATFTYIYVYIQFISSRIYQTLI